jgi:hypothetical protein
VLQCITEPDRFERPIPGRNGVEAHSAETMKRAKGTSRTRSARAVR